MRELQRPARLTLAAARRIEIVIESDVDILGTGVLVDRARAGGVLTSLQGTERCEIAEVLWVWVAAGLQSEVRMQLE